MEFSIRVLVVILLAIIAFVVLVALVAGWGGQSSGILNGMINWFKQLLSGQAAIPTGTESQTGSGSGSGVPGIGNLVKTP